MTIPELRSKLTASFEHLKGELSQIRSGRATTSLVEEVKVIGGGENFEIWGLAAVPEGAAVDDCCQVAARGEAMDGFFAG